MVRSRYTETSYTDDRDTIVVTVDLNNVQLLVREHATGRAVEVAMDPVCVKELIESLQEAQTEVGA